MKICSNILRVTNLSKYEWFKTAVNGYSRNLITIPKWTPEASNRNLFTNSCINTYSEQHQRSITDPESYWGDIATNTIWFKPYEKVLDNSNPPFTKWFSGGKLNMCYNAVDRHIDEGNGNRNAIVWDSPITNNKKTITYNEVLQKTAALARVLINMKVKKGDRVLIYMSMTPEALIAMLACARIGAIHSVVFGGFSSKELGARIRHCEPKVIITHILI